MKRPEPRYPDNPVPSQEEATQFIANGLVEIRSKPSPVSTEGKSHPVDEVRFVNGALNLYVGPTRANLMRQSVLEGAMKLSYELGVREQLRGDLRPNRDMDV